MVERVLRWTYTTGRKIVITLVGTTLILIGAAMIVLPGPAIVVVPLGLGVLGIEFAWARRFLHNLKQGASSTLERARGTRVSSPGAGSAC